MEANILAFVDHATRMKLINNKKENLMEQTIQKMNEMKESTDKEIFDEIKKIMPKGIQKLMEYGMSTKYYSPSLVLQQKLGEQTLKSCQIEEIPKAFVVNNNKNTITVNGKEVKCEIPELIKKHENDAYSIMTNQKTSDDTLYGNPRDEEFQNVLKNQTDINIRMFDASAVGKIERDMYHNNKVEHFERLQGYGVELQIKNLEYKTMDIKDEMKEETLKISKEDMEKLIEEHEDIRDNLKIYKENMIKKRPDGTYVPLPVRNIGYQLADMILTEAEKDIEKGFELFEKLTQNFPKEIKTILNHNSVRLREREHAIQQNYRLKRAGESSIQLNGIQFDLEKISIFTIYDILMKEITLSKALETHGVEDVQKILYVKPDEKSVPRFNMFHVNNNEQYITYLNDIERDHRYQQFRGSVKAILQPSYYGRRHFARKNMFEAIYIMDPSTRDGFHRLMHVFQIMNNGYPLRVGLVLTTFQNEGENNNAVDMEGNLQKGDKKISPNMQFLLILTHVFKHRGANGILQFMHMCRHAVQDGNGMTMDILRMEYVRHASQDVSFDGLYDKYGVEVEKRMAFLKKHGIGQSPSIVLNGQLISLDDRDYNELLFSNINAEYERMREHVQYQRIKDSDNIQEKILELDEAMPSYHPKVFEKPNFVAHSLPKNVHWFAKDTQLKKFSHVVCLNTNHRQATSFIKLMIEHLKEHKDTRMAFFNFDKTHTSTQRRAFAKLLKEGTLSTLEKALSSSLPKVEEEVEESTLCSQLYHGSLESNEVILYSNGRLLRVDINFDAINMVEKQELGFVDQLLRELKSPNSDQILHVSGLLHQNQAEFGYREESPHFNRQAALHYPGSKNLPHLTAHLNPISETGQHWITVLYQLAKHVNLPTLVYLNPEREYKNIPLKSYYRTVFQPFMSSNSPAALFKDLPSTHILTTNMKVPETWLIESTYAEPDTDNLNIGSASDLSIRYQLENIVITGSCYETPSQATQRGLQFHLGNSMDNHLQDTLVMSNYGYYQLKANPGMFELTLAPGRSTDVFSIDSYASTSFYAQQATQFFSGPVYIPIRHFDGPFIHVKVKKNAGFESEDLLHPKDDSTKSSQQDDDVVHIFTIASGHLYERLMRIMMKSVLTHTKSKVKFWIIKNYLSPQYKAILPKMAKKFGFDYGLVTYKWPTWLNKQTEKQRLIWAYKILFLDVLFPLDVHRIIYVDADQVTRADMTELYKMNIQNKAVAYTPFCSSRPEMDGYAFWKQGYWRNHLRGRPYHISALYLVDIDQLRRTYAGDRYRMIYDNLSKDPNSLANLDQDLPNYAQHNVPIFSLPQEWLWCETWCSQADKKKAKTIDLCNNPETKEHKVASAKRIVPEWIDYDKEVNQNFVNDE
eukprot:CAMPEP_0117423258 /NCGR_PEP_ID=MMETSP0758-20121206/3925_1 /TAXON_ID=63605 /ORGANISM="Percolomonas cosmopolitus, Strain AE-1 (ATCC 50343)" /LENGTH=1370 /DNA_ID=CAMNT_0005206353 /DNA_START=179 /DNA_END=4288 /DNA_ORIENTATION=+